MRIPFIGNVGNNGQPNPTDPPYSGSAPTQPLEQLTGHTTPNPDPGSARPRVGAPPIGQSGRANFYGLPEIDETNPRLAGIPGLRIFDEMYRQDPHIRRLILAAWSPITAGTWALEPYGGEDATDQDRKIAEQVWWMLSQWMAPNFQQHLHSLGPLLLRYGFVPFEQLWAPVKYQGKGATLLGPRKLDVRLPKTIWRWWQDDYGELTHIGQILPNRPDVVIPATDISYYRLGAEGDNWQGTSLLRHCYKPWFIKDRLERIDMIGQERKAVGVPILYHSTDVNADVLTDIERALANMHTSETAYLMLPGPKMGTVKDAMGGDSKQFLVDVIQFDSSSGSTIKDSIEYHQTSISASFLTDFLELGHHQVGARATAEVQEDPFLTAIQGALMPPVLPVLNELVDRIVKLNWDTADGSPKFQITLHDDASLSEISSYVQQLAMSDPPAITIDPDLEDWLRERAGLPPANQQARAKREQIDDAQHEAQLAGAQATAKDPQGVEKAAAVAKAAGKVPGDGDSEPPNPNKPAAAAKSKTLDQADAPVAAGLIVQADDTGRVLMIQRTDDHADDDDTRARWEFPGGKTDDGETLWQTGQREWEEETGATLPASARRVAAFTSPDGKYQAFGVRIPREAALKLGDHDPDEVAAVRWWKPEDLATDHRIRGKVQQALPDIHQLLTKPETKRLDAGAFWEYVQTRLAARRLMLDADPADTGDPADGRIVCDFDGVIRDENSREPIRDPLTGLTAIDVLPKLAREYEVVICTANKDLQEVRDWLRSHGLGQFADSVTHEKPAAQAYIDDNGIQFTLWHHVAEDVVAQVRRGRNPPQPKHLDDGGFQPLSGGAGENGLQMVPSMGETCPHCGAAISKRGSTCPACGAKLLDDAAAEPTARWFDRLLSQGRLREAFDGCRDHIEAAVGPAARLAAQQMAHQAANGSPTHATAPPAELVDALTQHYTHMYQLGAETVQAELAKQRAHLKLLDDPITDTAAGVEATRLARARQRGEHSARNIVNKVSEILGRAQITGLKEAGTLQTTAEQTARAQLHQEALNNTAAMVNDGRCAAAMSDGQVVGGVYTSVMDERSCDPCIAADTGDVLPPDQAILMGPPNPDCDGSDRCRCAIVWVLSDDPAALGSIG